MLLEWLPMSSSSTRMLRGDELAATRNGHLCRVTRVLYVNGSAALASDLSATFAPINYMRSDVIFDTEGQL